jgi:protein ImuA
MSSTAVITGARIAPPLPFVGQGLHELYAESGPDAPGLTGAGLALATLASGGRPLLWVRQAFLDSETGAPSATGLPELGIDPARIIRLRAVDPLAALQAGLEGARCRALGGTIVEMWGEARAYDLTASRRLALAARESGTSLLLLRAGAEPRSSAAKTRWSLRSAPSRALAANAPGPPVFALTLLRARDGREGESFIVEWDRDARAFTLLSPAGHRAGRPYAFAAHGAQTGAQALSGVVVSLPAGRTNAGALRRAG